MCPKRVVPQGGILSPLLSNVVLNELDWWIASQWEAFPTKTNYTHEVSRYQNLRRTSHMKEVFIVRYADDFKLFCKCRSDAERIFTATTMWLKERLGLEISPEKSKIVNLKKGIFRLPRFQIEAPPKEQEMGVEITHGRQGTEKVQRKHTRGHWSNRQRAEPMERYAV